MMNYRLLLSRLLLLLLPVLGYGNLINTTNGAFCGWDPAWEDNYYAIIDQYELVSPDFHAFLNCPDTPFCDNIKSNNTSTNIEEWIAYLNGGFNKEELLELMYRRPNGWFFREEGFDDFELLNRLDQKEFALFKEYLFLAKNTENTTSDRSNGTGWHQGEGYYTNTIARVDKKELLSKALELAAKAPDDFMRNRAGFQAVKLAHYLQENDAAIRYFNTILKKSTSGNYIYYRAMEEMAGAAFNQGRHATAANAYLEIYDQLPDRRSSCASSLRLLDWEFLESASEFVYNKKNNDVKSFFKAFHGRGSVIREMEHIVKEDVNSPYLEVLGVRFLDQLQSSIFEHNASGYYEDYQENEDLDQFYFFMKRLLNNEELKNQDLWSLILATTYLAQGEHGLALSYMSTLKPHKTYDKHFKRLKTAVGFMNIKSIDRERINESYELIASDKVLRTHQATVAAFFNHISALYNDENDPITSVIASVSYDSYINDKPYDWDGVMNEHSYNWNYNSKYHYLDEEIINNFDLFINLPNPTSFEKTILKRMKTIPQDYVHDLRGTYYMRIDRLEDALIEFKQVKNPEVFWEKEVRTELFSAAIKEWMNVPFTSISNNFHKKHKDVLGKNAVIRKESLERESYKDNKIKLTETLIKLKQLAVSQTDNTADYYYMIGNAWYNMSYKGWFMNNTYYIGNNNRNELSGSYYSDNDEREEIDNDFMLYQASQYLLKGLQFENGSRETKAAILFMLAKTNSCENGSYDYNYDSYDFNICNDHKIYFEQLEEVYSDTQYYKEVLRECSWFKNYVN